MKSRVLHNTVKMTGECLASFDGNFFLDSIVAARKSNGQRGKKGVTPFSSSNLLAREYDKEISRLTRLSPAWSEKNGTSGSVEHVPRIGRRASSAVENSKKSGARMYMRADVEIFLKGTAGQDADGGWDRTWERGRRLERSGKSLAKGAPPARGFSERNGRER